MDFEIVNGYYTGLLTAPERPKYATKYSAMFGSIKKENVIEKLKKKFRARQMFGDKWILNQGRRGSCNGYACAGSLSRVVWIAGRGFVTLSGEFVYSFINDGVDRGSLLSDGMKFLMENGACRKELVEHETYLKRDISSEAVKDAKNYLAHECLEVESDLECADAIANNFILVVAVHASNSYMRLDHNGIAGESNSVGNHSVTVDDCVWDGDQFVYDQPNSWGLNWGENGRCRLTWNKHLRKTTQYHQFFAIRGVSDSQDGLFA